MIDIALIGTAALVPLPDRALTAAQLVCGGHSILFDCGEGTQSAARKADVSLMKTDLIALTHYHGDHIFGLPGLLQTMCSMGRTETLTITGPAGLTEALEPILKLVGWTSYEIRLTEMPRDGLALDTLAEGWPAGAGVQSGILLHPEPRGKVHAAEGEGTGRSHESVGASAEGTERDGRERDRDAGAGFGRSQERLEDRLHRGYGALRIPA